MAEVRISDQARYLGMIPNYNSLLAQVTKLQQQVGTGHLLANAQDDPVAVSISEGDSTQEARLTQDSRNVTQASGFVNATEQALSSAVGYVQQAGQLAISAADPSLSNTDLQNLSKQVDGILQNMVNLGATQYDGRTLFSGSGTDKPAFQTTVVAGQITAVNAAPTSNTESLTTEITPGQTVAYNLVGSSAVAGVPGVFQDATSGVDVFKDLIQLRDDIASNNLGNVTADHQKLQGDFMNITTAQQRLGGIQGHLQDATTTNGAYSNVLMNMVSSLTSTDVAKAATELTATQTAYQGALAVGSKIGQLSLLNYLSSTVA
ncbi:MAG: flagellin [Planctomycetota bacterium]